MTTMTTTKTYPPLHQMLGTTPEQAADIAIYAELYERHVQQTHDLEETRGFLELAHQRLLQELAPKADS